MITRILAGAALIPALAVPLALAGPPAGDDPADAAALVTFTGAVTDDATGRPIGGAQVFVEGTSLGTLTAANGRYEIAARDDRLVGTTVTLRVRLIGFAEASREVRVDGPGEITTDFRLEPASLALDELVVTGERDKAEPTTRPLPTGVPAPAAARQAQGFAVDASAARNYRGRPGAGFNTESYAHIVENRWLTPSRDPLSTFSIDVDRASYSNVRRFIHDGVRPPIDAVRIEEMINYFPYDYAEPRGEHPFAISTEVGPAPWNEAHRLVRIGIQGRRVDLEALPPSNLVFLLDVSGSMMPANKLPLLKRSLRMLVDELRPDDRVAIVVYAGAAGLVLESTPGRQRERILDALEGLEAGGSTAGGAGLALAYRVAARNHIEGGNNRVILATDGDFNVGPSSDSEMIRLIEEKRDQGTFLTVLGFGAGNLKDSKMEALADHGNGNYAYIDGLLEARKVLVTEMGGTLLTIAKDVKIQVEFNPARVQAYRLIGYENRLLAAEDFNDDTKDAGELGAGHTVTALYEIVPPDAPPVEVGTVDGLRYSRPGPLGAERSERTADPDRATGSARRGADASTDASTDELLFVKLRYKAPDGEVSRLIERPVRDAVGAPSADLRFASAVAAFGMLLRDSEHCGDLGLRDVAALARGAVGGDEHGYRSEFVRLVEAAGELELLSLRR